MESDARFYRRRVNEELAAADRAVTEAARERRMILAGLFLERLKACEEQPPSLVGSTAARDAETPAFGWR